MREEGSDITAERIVAHCEKGIDRFKRPRRVIFVEHLPADPSGKVSGRRLRELLESQGGAAG